MREIKFRVWDKINKKWIKHFNIDLLNIDVSELPNIEIMQYTGLNDKNEKEIYEGDILEIDESITKDGKKHRFSVSKIKGAFCISSDKVQGISSVFDKATNDNVMTLFELFENYNEDLTIDELDYAEVIGNIYENPELLEE